jgi:hypothetical protein
MLIDEMREMLKQGGVTFVELSRIDGFTGDLTIYSGENENVVFW